MVNICIIGIGRIGLALALVCAKKGHKVIGVDENQNRLLDIQTNNLPKKSLERKLLSKFFEKNFFITDDLHFGSSQSDVIFITVGTTLGNDKKPDLTDLFKVVGDLCNNLQNIKEKLIVLKSTLPLGTTRKIIKFIEKKTKLECGKDFFMVFSPERVLGNKAISEMQSLPKIIGGIDSESTKKAVKIYSTIGGKIIVVDRPEVAELLKLIDNSYRQTMFAFSNDVALVAEKFGLDVYDVIEVANDSYQRNNIPEPSSGVSGYCLTKDPLFLEDSFKDLAKERGFSSVWKNARKSNDFMPVHVVNLLKRELLSTRKSLQEANILVCGITYKENIDDIRFSHGIEIVKKLEEIGVNVYVWDPNVNHINLKYSIINDHEISTCIKKMDALVFTVKHDEFIMLNENNRILSLLKKMRTPVIVDGCGIFRKLKNERHIYYVGVGVPSSRLTTND